MDWINFERMSPEVEAQLAEQRAWLSSVAHPAKAGRTESRRERARRLETLLRHHAPTNPWGHPPAEC